MSLGYRVTPATVSATGTVPKQTGTAAGDLVLLAVLDYSQAGKTIACSGFTSQNTSSTTFGSVALLTRACDGTESANFTLTTTGTAASLYTIIVTLSGGAAYDTASIYESAGSVTTIPVPGITVAHPGSWALYLSQAIAVPDSPPAGYTARVNASGIVVADNQSVAAGATGTVTGTCGSGAAYGVLVSVYIPAAGSTRGAMFLDFMG